MSLGEPAGRDNTNLFPSPPHSLKLGDDPPTKTLQTLPEFDPWEGDVSAIAKRSMGQALSHSPLRNETNPNDKRGFSV